MEVSKTFDFDDSVSVQGQELHSIIHTSCEFFIFTCNVLLLRVLFFPIKKQSEVLPFPFSSSTSNPLSTRYCNHKKALLARATFDKSASHTGFMPKIAHQHNPVGISTRRGGRGGGVGKRGRRGGGGAGSSSRKKKLPYSGLNVAQMLEAREAERQRINEVRRLHTNCTTNIGT